MMSDKIEVYIKQARKNLNAGNYDGDLSELQMLEQLQDENERLREALQINTGAEALYVPMMVPKEIIPELRARRRFAELVLSGMDIKEAKQRAGDKEVKRIKQALKGD